MRVIVRLNGESPTEIPGPDLEKPDLAFSMIRNCINMWNSDLPLNFSVEVLP